MLTTLAIAAICLAPPVTGPVVAGFAPIGQYSGHWGLDYGAEVGSAVRAPVSGTVTFAGSVAGMRSVTIEALPGFKVSLSYLGAIAVGAGHHVARGQHLGVSALAHGAPAVHLSTRIGGSYVDPLSLMGCRDTDITRALRLITPPRTYPRPRAHRDPRRDL
jgi:murein DD-endopeptidase MepM/ murein hydrolase activator NlpD